MTILTRQTLQHILPDTTHVLERNGKEAYVHLARDGSGHMLLEDGETRAGTWRMLDDGYATEWDTGDRGEWTLQSDTDGLAYVSRDGTQQVKMLGILFGNPKGLPR